MDETRSESSRVSVVVHHIFVTSAVVSLHNLLVYN